MLHMGVHYAAGLYNIDEPVELLQKTAPRFIDARGARWKVTAPMPYALKCEKLHGIDERRVRYFHQGLMIDSNNLADQGVIIHGSQDGVYDMAVTNSVTNNFLVRGDQDTGGVYYNDFHLVSNTTQKGSGIKLDAIGAKMQNSSNRFYINSKYSALHGIEAYKVQGAFYAPNCEHNGGSAFHVRETRDFCAFGNFTEYNRSGYYLDIDKTARGVKFFGGRPVEGKHKPGVNFNSDPQPIGFLMDCSIKECIHERKLQIHGIDHPLPE